MGIPSVVIVCSQARVQEFARGGGGPKSETLFFFFAFQFLGGGQAPCPPPPPLDTRLAVDY